MSAPVELTRTELEHFRLPPISEGDKDDHGKLLIVAGSRQVPGAAMLSASAALRTGAGKIRIATVSSVASGLALMMPEAFIVALPEAQDGGFASGAAGQVGEEARHTRAIVAGPGVPQGTVTRAIARELLASNRPLAIDAGFLHCLAPLAQKCRNCSSGVILLPHSREMASLLDIGEEEVEADRMAAAHKAAQRYGAFVLAKGAQSCIVAPDGRSWMYRGGAPGLGVAGSGDALSGIVGALLARGAEPLTALLWAVLLHGEAGERLSKKIGPVGFLAREIPDEIPALLAL